MISSLVVMAIVALLVCDRRGPSAYLANWRRTSISSICSRMRAENGLDGLSTASSGGRNAP